MPNDVQIVNGEIKVTKQYLRRMLSDVSSVVTAIEKHADKKFF